MGIAGNEFEVCETRCPSYPFQTLNSRTLNRNTLSLKPKLHLPKPPNAKTRKIPTSDDARRPASLALQVSSAVQLNAGRSGR